MKVRSALAALIAAAALAAVGVPTAAASSSTGASPQVTNVAPLYTMPISGVAKNGKTFTGSYGIQRFVVKNGQVWSVGTLKGRLKGRHVTRGNVMMPASLTDSSGNATTSQAGTCQVLHLVLGPINLNLLGLHVTLGGGTAANQPIVLDITAQQGGGLLGDLLCGLTNALSGQLGALSGQLSQLASTLNSIVALLGGLQATLP
jgi:hypothetical protein